MILMSVLIVTRLARKVLTEKDIMDLAWHQMSFLDIITLDKEQKSKLSDILRHQLTEKGSCNSHRVNEDNTN